CAFDDDLDWTMVMRTSEREDENCTPKNDNNETQDHAQIPASPPSRPLLAQSLQTKKNMMASSGDTVPVTRASHTLVCPSVQSQTSRTRSGATVKTPQSCHTVLQPSQQSLTSMKTNLDDVVPVSHSSQTELHTPPTHQRSVRTRLSDAVYPGTVPASVLERSPPGGTLGTTLVTDLVLIPPPDDRETRHLIERRSGSRIPPVGTGGQVEVPKVPPQSALNELPQAAG
ncbi:hypothetical protein FOL47_003713, partial [Perkinsus chesapeaki]